MGGKEGEREYGSSAHRNGAVAWSLQSVAHLDNAYVLSELSSAPPAIAARLHPSRLYPLGVYSYLFSHFTGVRS